MKSINELRELFNSKIPYESFNRQPAALYEPFSYMLQLSGKRMRPVLVLLGCEMFNTPAEEALPQAIAIELFHNFTLIHDDIMDEAPLRRGLPTVHQKFNSNTAILSGDAMLVFAYQQLLRSKPALLHSLISLFNKTAIEVCEGQQIDMLFEKRNDVRAEEYLNMIELKTAVLLGCSLEMGALVAGAFQEQTAKMNAIGRHLGIAFQLQDDLLDSFGDEKKFGKQTGGDILQNKKTLLLIEALNRATGNAKAELTEWLNKKEFDPRQKIRSILSIYEQLNIRSITEQQIKKHYEAAMKELSAVNIAEENKAELIGFAEALKVRQH